MLDKLRLAVRLMAGFGVVTLLFMIVTLVGVTSLQNVNQEIDDMVKDKFPKTVWANDIVESINIIARAARNALLVTSDEEMKKEMARFEEPRKIIKERLEKLQETIHSDKGKAVLKDLTDARAIYLQDQDNFINLVNSGKKDEARQLMLGSIRKSQGNYVAAVVKLIDFQTGLMNESGKTADVAADNAVRLMLFMARRVSPTALPPSTASLDDWVAMPSVTLAFSVFWAMLALICSMPAVVSSTPAACSEAPWARLWLVAAIWLLAEPRLSAAARTSEMVVASLSTMFFMANNRLPWSSARVSILTLKSPAATLDTMSAA